MHQNTDKYIVRFPAGLRERIKAAAKENCRSMNAEMVFHLQRALMGAEAATGVSLQANAPAAALNTGALQGADNVNPRY